MCPDDVDADVALEVEDQTGADRLDDRRGAAFFAVHRVGEIDVLGRVDVGHRATADDDGHRVGEQIAPDRENPWSAGTADELVRREYDGVLVREGIGGIGLHVDLEVGRGSRVVPHRQRAVAVQQARDGAGIGRDARDVRGRAERPDLERSVGVLMKLALEAHGIDVAVGVLGNLHHIGDGLAPRQLVAVVLERADEHDRSLVARDLCRELPLQVEIGRDAQVEDADQLVDRARGPGAGEEHDRVVPASERLVDDAARVLSKPSRLQAGTAALGVRVGVAGEHLVAHEVLEEPEGAP